MPASLVNSFFVLVGYNAAAFLRLWNTSQRHFLRCGIQRRKFSSVVEFKRRTIAGRLTPFLPLFTTTQEFFFLCIPHRKRIFSVVSHNTEGSLLFLDTTEKNDTSQNDIFKF
jgi:hypothetical protein